MIILHLPHRQVRVDFHSVLFLEPRQLDYLPPSPRPFRPSFDTHSIHSFVLTSRSRYRPGKLRPGARAISKQAACGPDVKYINHIISYHIRRIIRTIPIRFRVCSTQPSPPTFTSRYGFTASGLLTPKWWRHRVWRRMFFATSRWSVFLTEEEIRQK
ncbi:hypothetical protein B0H12DRAFT_1130477 [Mycena haematopus]|nr:hypothetical protein B0H12DRAFT_1130477 [Mycena haematopus]